MPGKRGLPQCVAITLRGERCKARAIKDNLCECHCPETAAAFHARNRAGRDRYWQMRRLAEALAATGGA
jgi:hypothetical protein